jgi:hypothetical protein
MMRTILLTTKVFLAITFIYSTSTYIYYNSILTHQMESLPAEIIFLIIRCLDSSTLVNILCTSSSLYSYALETLFCQATFYVDPYTANLTLKSSQLLSQLYSQRRIGDEKYKPVTFIREVVVLPDPKPNFRVKPTAFRTLSTTFLQLLQNKHIQVNLRSLCWRVGYLETLETYPLRLPPCIRVLELLACQIDYAIIFPSLKSLIIRQLSTREASWISRQIESSYLETLYISASSRDSVCISECASLATKHLVGLISLGLEHINLDSWPLPREASLKSLTIRSCSGLESTYTYLTPNISTLHKLALVTNSNIENLEGFQYMLRCCHNLKDLTLLVGGRTSTVPLEWVQPVWHTLQTLVLETRQFLALPALSIQYTLEDVSSIVRNMPQLEVLGLSINVNSLRKKPVRAPTNSVKRSSNCVLIVELPTRS